MFRGFPSDLPDRFDVGGTFTYIVVMDEFTGMLTIAKSSTPPQDPMQGISPP